jgi:hypothetical protein
MQPLATMKYCLNSEGGVPSGDSAAVAAAMVVPGGWTLGGRLAFVPTVAGACDLTLRLVPAKAMGNLDPACAQQTTCTVGNVIEISLASWGAAPKSWEGTLASYRTELVNHELGHWLGFNHAACGAKASAALVLQAPTVTLPGCSPNWYEIDPNSQGTKVLPGF